MSSDNRAVSVVDGGVNPAKSLAAVARVIGAAVRVNVSRKSGDKPLWVPARAVDVRAVFGVAGVKCEFDGGASADWYEGWRVCWPEESDNGKQA